MRRVWDTNEWGEAGMIDGNQKFVVAVVAIGLGESEVGRLLRPCRVSVLTATLPAGRDRSA